MRERVVEMAEAPSGAETVELIEKTLANRGGVDPDGAGDHRGRCCRTPMSAVVLDASALLVAMTRTDADAAALRRRLAATDCHAPHLIDAEVGNVLRRMTLRGELAPGLAELLLSAGPQLVRHRHDQAGRARGRCVGAARERQLLRRALHRARRGAGGRRCSPRTRD